MVLRCINPALCRALSCTEQGGYPSGLIERPGGLLIVIGNTGTTEMIHHRLKSSMLDRDSGSGILKYRDYVPYSPAPPDVTRLVTAHVIWSTSQLDGWI